MISYETRTGSIGFTENFLSKLIGHAVTSCFGVVGMMPSSNRQRLFGLVSKLFYVNWLCNGLWRRE